ncbi:TPA: hypothetical protein L4S08_003672 [Pseudomonas aeruginosa]|uniref:hypothetical protein n=1 Tax=Pseudomonas aeruginosa TaxID=287 RepID=UPI000AB59FD6|nr:hypothetical protein [Pseudomonas aeruginosa]MBG4296165.1 hypothetical protein [Pseudomonas aeruginosa]HBO0775573.1 hypothetical protein [Pseudomonas aeruginosa]HBO3284705.1 hypothetical protein [Pseudomonas aeruginosa]HEJ4007874.1 hypothetical protein [Pseudomonas aeruginosa]HEJ5158753.1 hypothetical protein [Pseudomonas aeruginosa]
MTASKIQMDQIRSTSATVTDENIRAGSQKKSSLSPAEGLQGASPDATCTCPSGDGSLVHPCPAHPASVEQAGGDERTAFEAWMTWLMDHVYGRLPDFTLDDGSGAHYVNADVSYAWTAWQARAALAQPSPVRSSLLINGYQLRAALEFIAPDGTAKQLESEARIEWRQQDADFLEAGLYAWCAEYPEEGCVLLDEEPATAQPSPAQAEQAEPERPEVVAWQYRVTAGPQTGWSLWLPGKGEEFERSYTVERRPLMTVAQYERITAKLHDALDESDGDRWKMRSERDAANARLHEVATACATAEQERDAALARVAELESKLAELEMQAPVAFLYRGTDMGVQLTIIRLDHYWRPKYSTEEHDYIKGIPLYAAPVAQAQHSVPEGWMLVPVEPLLNMMSDKDHDTRITAERQLLSILAAAPGKEEV